MNDRADPRHGPVQSTGVSDVTFDHFCLHPLKMREVARCQVVENTDAVATFYKAAHQGRAHKARPASYKNRLFVSHFSSPGGS